MVAHRARVLLVAAIALLAFAPSARAQIEGGLQGSVNAGIREGAATIGIGGRIGAYLFTTGDFAWKADANFDYFFTSCGIEGARCWAYHAHANILGTRKFGEPVLGYFGFGAAYQHARLYSTSGGDLNATQGHAGVNLLVGAQLPDVGVARPFFEARFAIFDYFPNQLVVSLGMLFSTGTSAP
jgi:hypothetical protein